MSADAPVLLDNCAISACVKVGCWKALAGRYVLETVERVAAEAGTGAQTREIIDPREFNGQVKVHAVSREERLASQAAHTDLSRLDEGELDLWVHALGREDGWILCGPDIASIRFGVRAGYADRLISLEELLTTAGFKPRVKLDVHQTKAWLAEKVSQFRTELEFEKLKAKGAGR
jgi:hypothetical protein